MVATREQAQAQAHGSVRGPSPEGALIKLKVSYWRGSVQALAEDLGLGASQVQKDLLTLGRKRIVTPARRKWFAAFAESARVFVREHGGDFPLLEGVTFVPYANLPMIMNGGEKRFLRADGTFEEKRLPGLWERKEQFNEAAKDLIENLSEIVEELMGQYEVQARDIWRSRHPNGGSETMMSGFVAEYLERVREDIPSPEHLQKLFDFSWTLFEVRSPSTFEGSHTTADYDRARQTAIHDIVAAEQRKAQEDIQGALAGAVREVAGRVRDVVASMVAGLTEGKFVRQQTLDQVSNLARQIRGFQFAVPELTSQLDALSQQIEGIHSRDLGTNPSQVIRASLDNLQQQAEAVLSADADLLNRRFGQVGRRKIGFKSLKKG